MSTDTRIAARIAWHHFQEGLTQGDIAKLVGLSRGRVNQILGELRSDGVVQIKINTPMGACHEAEVALVQDLGLGAAIVVPNPAPATDVRRVTGIAAGQYLSELLENNQSVGIGWGGTIDAAASAVRQRRDATHTVVSLCGGFPVSTPINPYDVAARFARALNGNCLYITAPMFADSKEMRELLCTSSAIEQVLQRVPDIDVALLSAADLTPQSRSLQYGLIDDDLRQSLLKAGAVGDICGHFLDAEGNAVDHPLVEKVVAPSIASIQKIKTRILVTGGAQKSQILKAAYKAGIFNVLITDETSATALLEEHASSKVA